MINAFLRFYLLNYDHDHANDQREHDHIASDLFNIHESDREMKPDVYVSKAAHVEGFPKSFEKIGGTISGQNRLSLTNIYYYVEKLNCIIVLI